MWSDVPVIGRVAPSKHSFDADGVCISISDESSKQRKQHTRRDVMPFQGQCLNQGAVNNKAQFSSLCGRIRYPI